MEHIKGLGIPYMGSKRKLAPKIVDKILEDNPKCKYFYDLFGGGGAISFEASQRIDNVYYNEFDTGITELLQKIKKEGITEEFYKWIDRETFFEMKEGKCWEGGFIKTCWSFGNNGNSYMYSKNIEEENITVNEARLKQQRIFTTTLNDKEKKELKEKIGCIVEGGNVRVISQHLERIQHLQKLKDYINFNISNLSYEKVEINTPVEETIIYLDPPYQNTYQYQNDIDHEKLWEWVRNCPYKVYISSYEAPFEEVLSMEHRTTVAQKANNKVVEKLFVNKPLQ